MNHNNDILVSALTSAIHHNKLHQVYQPKIDSLNGKVVGVEALSRWNDPVLGSVPPSVFIPLAEKYNLMEPLTLNAITSIVSQCAIWNQQGINLKMSINASMQDLHSEKIVGHMCDALIKFNVDPTQIVLEITETAIMEDRDQCANTLSVLNAMGIGLSIDDFGIGHAPFVYLKHFPINEIKIDKMFVDEVATNPKDAAIVKCMVDLGHATGCVVVAEGVENEQTAKTLKSLGCDILQGYYFSKPIKAHEIVNFINAREKVIA